MKYITVFLLGMVVSLPSWAEGKFIPLKPAERTLVHGKTFMALGGGQSPMEMASLQQDFISFRRNGGMAPPIIPAREKKMPEEITETAPEPIDAKPTPEAKTQPLPEPHPQPKPTALTHREQFRPSYLRELSSHRWPIAEASPSPISSPFGYRKHPITGEFAKHEGVDIAAPKGSPVVASARGKVSDIGYHRNLGRYVKVVHSENSYSLYGHLSEITTKPGTAVSAGDTIGKVGSTGRSTGPHLDYSLRIDGKAVDPLPYLQPQRQWVKIPQDEG